MSDLGKSTRLQRELAQRGDGGDEGPGPGKASPTDRLDPSAADGATSAPTKPAVPSDTPEPERKEHIALVEPPAPKPAALAASAPVPGAPEGAVHTARARGARAEPANAAPAARDAASAGPDASAAPASESAAPATASSAPASASAAPASSAPASASAAPASSAPASASAAPASAAPSPSAPPAPSAAPPSSASAAGSGAAGAGERTEGGDGHPHGHAHGRGTRHADRAAAPPAAPVAPAALGHQVLHEAPGDPSLERTTVGVGEQVRFSDTAAGAWTASAGIGALTATGTDFTWTAPGTPGTVAISHARDGGGAAAPPVTMTVVAPERAEFRKTSDVPQAPAGVGMVTNLHFFPNTVSFSRAEWLEEPRPVASATGYFRDFINAGLGDLYHHPAADWIPMGARNNGVDDSAYTRAKPPLGNPPRYYEGDFAWDIPNRYRVTGQGGDGTVYETTRQTFHMDGGGTAGRITVTKQGQSASQTVQGVAEGTDPDLIDHFATTGDALAWLRSDGVGFGQGLVRLATLRARDQASYQNLVSALRQFPPPALYIGLTCRNSYSWVFSDSGSLAVSGNTGTQSRAVSIDTGVTRNIRIPFLDLFDLDRMDSTTGLSFALSIEGRTHRLQMPIPFTALGSDTEMEGSGGRYVMRTFLSTRSS